MDDGVNSTFRKDDTVDNNDDTSVFIEALRMARQTEATRGLKYPLFQNQPPLVLTSPILNPDDVIDEDVFNALEKFSPQFHRRIMRDGLTYESMTEWQRAKYRAAAEAVRQSELNNKTFFDKKRKEFEKPMIDDAVSILNQNQPSSESPLNIPTIAVQTTLRKIDEWADVEMVSDLKQPNPDGYNQFLFDVYQLGAKRTKNDVRTLIRRASNDKALELEQAAGDENSTI